MAIMLCGVVAASAPRPESAPDHVIAEVGDWAALAIPVDAGPVSDAEADAQRMLDWAAHQNRLLCGYIAQTDVLPVALGAVFSGERALRAYIRAEHDGIASRLAPLAGRVELGLQMLEIGAPPPEKPEARPEQARSGRAFLMARRKCRDRRSDRARARSALSQSLSDGLERRVVSVQRRPPRDASRLADWALLVEREALPDLADWLGTQLDAAETAGATLRLIGPMPAFSFCTDHEAAA